MSLLNRALALAYYTQAARKGRTLTMQDNPPFAELAHFRQSGVTPKTETLGNVTTCIEWGGPSAEMELEDPRV